MSKITNEKVKLFYIILKIWEEKLKKSFGKLLEVSPRQLALLNQRRNLKERKIKQNTDYGVLAT